MENGSIPGAESRNRIMQKLRDGDIGQRRLRRSPHVGLIILGGDGCTGL